jgi:hypothetical protein
MTRERDAAVVEVAGQGRLALGRVAAAEEPGQRERRVVAGQDRLEGNRRRDRAAGAAGDEPPQRPQQQPAQEEAGAQLNTTTPRATCPVRSAVKPSLIWSSE